MITAPGADCRILPRPKNQQASSTPSPGPGFVSSRNMIDCPVSRACSMPIGEKMPWFRALLRNSTLDGSTRSDTSGSSPWRITTSTPLLTSSVSPVTAPPMTQ